MRCRILLVSVSWLCGSGWAIEPEVRDSRRGIETARDTV